MARIEGGCLCGRVRYSSEAPAVMTAVCHCRHCQRQSGSAFSIIIGLPKGALQVQGALASYEDVGESGMPVLRRFCSHCGSPILSEVASSPQLDFVKAGTLDDTSWLAPQVHIWCEHRQPWVSVPDGVPQVPRNPPRGG